jgi:hypothetical protein
MGQPIMSDPLALTQISVLSVGFVLRHCLNEHPVADDKKQIDLFTSGLWNRT